jgi:hypothetical protein
LAAAVVAPAGGETTAERESRLLGDLKFLAADEQQGRGIGTAGIDRAAEFIRDEFAKAGLDVSRVDSGAFQQFTMVTGSELGKPNKLSITPPDGTGFELKYDTDFRTCSFGGAGQFSGEPVFCGYGIDAADKQFQELEAIDLDGKVAIIMRRVPQQGEEDGPFGSPHGGISRHGDLTSKVSNAFAKNAAAVLFVSDPYTIRKNSEKEEKKGEADPLMKFGYGGNGKDRTIPIMHITQAACNRLIEPALGKTLADLEAEIDSDLKPRSIALSGWNISGSTALKRIRRVTKNVIGVLEGEGPLADETIVIGAHYDHLGLGGAGSFAPNVREVHNGADDNASGTVVLLELARRFAARDEKLPRRLVFIAFSGEETGLVGSARYVKEPLFPLEKTVAMLNMDMVGRLRDDKLTVFGIGTAVHWKDMIEAGGKTFEFTLSLKPEGFGPSDHTSFYAKKIPVLHFFTGVHSDYHRPSDDWEKVNVPGMVRILDLIEKVVTATATAPERPQYVEVKQKATMRRGGSRPYFGSIPDFGAEASGYAISGVTADSPAAKGGLAGGDVIVQIGPHKIGGLDDFDLALRKLSAGEEIDVVVMRNKKRLRLKVMLDKPR